MSKKISCLENRAYLARKLGAIAALVLLGGLLSATLVRMAPGFDSDERELDPSLNAESVRALRAVARGRAQHSRAFTRAISAAPSTAISARLMPSASPCKPFCASAGPSPCAWLASGFCWHGCWLRLWLSLPASGGARLYEIFGTTVSGAFLCIPAAVLALLSVILNAPGYLAIALIVFPKIYRYSRNLLAKAYALPHITAARARGLGELRILAWHVLPVAGPQLIALAGVTDQPRARRQHSRRKPMRIARHRPARLAGRALHETSLCSST